MYHNFKIPLSTSHYSSFKSNILFFNTFEVWEQQRNREGKKKKKKHQGEWVGGLERNKLDDLDQHLTRNAKGGSSWLLTGPLFTTPNTNPVEVHWMKRRVEKQGAVSDFSIFRILLWLQVCARSESWLGGAVGGGRWSWVTHKMSHRSSYKHKKRPRSFPPPLLLASFRCSFLLSLTHVAKKRKVAQRKSTWGHHNKYFVNQLKYRGQNALWFTDWSAAKRQSACMTHWICSWKSLEGKKEIRKIWGAGGYRQGRGF